MDIAGTDPAGLVISALALFASIVGIIVSIAGVIVSYIVAKKYGDLAAVKASRKLHEEDARRARLMALRSLLNEVERIQKVVEHNGRLSADDSVKPIVRMPVIAFETAFVAGNPSLEASEKTVKAVTDYLVCADSTNSLIDIYLSSVSAEATRISGSHVTFSTGYCNDTMGQIATISQQEFPEILTRLRASLQRELENTPPGV